MNNIEWVVRITLADGTVVRGIQMAQYGHPAIKFFANGREYLSASAEKKIHFDYFLERGLRVALA